MSQEENRTQSLSSYSDGEEEVLMDFEESEKPNSQRRRLDKKWISVPEQVFENEEEENLDDLVEPGPAPTSDYNDKVGKKRQRKNKDESSLKKTKKKKKKDSVSDNLDNSAEINEMWDSITNNSKDGDDNVVANCSKKKINDEDDDEIIKMFKIAKRKKKGEKTAAEIGLQVEEIMANLEIAVEDDVELNKQGKPAISKLMKLPLLNETLSKKNLQNEFLDHGVLNLLKNWLEPLPDGSLPNITIRSAILKILNDLPINLDQDSRREQLSKSGLGTVVKFLSESDEETIPNKRLANELVNKWGRMIYKKSTRYENMLTEEEIEEQRQMLLRRQMVMTPPKQKLRDFDIDIDFSEKPRSKEGANNGRRVVERGRVPKAISMDFTIRPGSKIDKALERRVKMQMDESSRRENIIWKLKQKKMHRKKSLQAFKPSAEGRTMLKYL